MGNSILVIDDEPDFIETARRGLVTSGFKNVRLESDSMKAAAFFEQGEAVDIALIDITMPWMNGVELLEAIKSFSPNTECIMITAVNEANVAVESLKKGAYDYLDKPISRDDLVLAINRALERKRLLDILDLGKKKSLPKLKHVKAFKPIADQVCRHIQGVERGGTPCRKQCPCSDYGGERDRKGALGKGHPFSQPQGKISLHSCQHGLGHGKSV